MVITLDHSDHQVIDRIVASIHCTLETNITLYINYTSKIKEKTDSSVMI